MIKELIKNYKSNLPIILIIIYSLGYAYLNRYFSRFDIKIEHYINLTDILFFTVKSLLDLTLVFIIIESLMWIMTFYILVGYYRLINRKYLTRIDQKIPEGKKLYDRYYSLKVYLALDQYFRDVSVVIFFFSSLIIAIWTKEYLNIASVALPFLVVKVYSSIQKPEKKEKGQNLESDPKNHKYNESLIFLVVLMISLVLYFGVAGNKNGNSVKSKNSNSSPLEFVHDSVTYSTVDSTFNLIGETSTFLFLYNYSNKKTYIFSKDNISQIRILDPVIEENRTRNLAQKNTERWYKNIQEYFTAN